MSSYIPLLLSEKLQSLPNVRHGFTTRVGGVSHGDFDSLNVAMRTEDERSHVLTNRQRVLSTLGTNNWVSLRQTHSADVVEVTAGVGPNIEADGLWTRDPTATLAVLSADCLPILLADKKGRAVAAVHAGWRGTVARIAAVAVKRLQQAGITPDDLLVALGPCIGTCCFEIQSDVSDVIQKSFAELSTPLVHRDGKVFGDLKALNRSVLTAAGVPDSNIEVLADCTMCSERLYSHRRDAGRTGRQAGVIAMVNTRT